MGGGPGDQVFPADLTNQVFLGDLDPTTQSADIFLGNIYTNAVGGTGGQVFLTNQYFPNPLPTVLGGIVVGNIGSSDFYGGGQVVIDARSDVVLNGTVNLSSFDLSSSDPATYPQNSYLGNGGDFVLLAQNDVQLSSGSQLLSYGLLGGSIRFDIGGTFLADNTVIRSRTYTSAVGLQGGDLNITADQIQAVNGSSFFTNTFGKGNAGAIDITSTGNIALTSSAIGSTVKSGAEGASGDITIDTGSLSLVDGAVINASTFGTGDSGAIDITATGDISLAGEDSQGFDSGIASQVAPGAEGASGGITIDTGSLSLVDGAVINASTFGTGDSGAIDITATGDISLAGVSAIGSTVESGAEGASGGITIDTGSLSLADAAAITASTFGRGDAGGIDITVTEDIFLAGKNSQQSKTLNSLLLRALLTEPMSKNHDASANHCLRPRAPHNA